MMLIVNGRPEWPSVWRAVSIVFLATVLAAPVHAASPPTLSAEAKAALLEMSNYLRSLKSFEVSADGTAEAMADKGQNVEFGLQVHYLVQVPDRLMGEVSTGARKVQFFYDGSKFTVAAVGRPYYAEVPMAGSLSTLLAKAERVYGVTLPLESLFRWGDPSRPQEMPTSGFKVGTARCGTEICDQYAFRQPGYDWQMWVRQGAAPLPVRLVFTATDRLSRPRTTADLNWVTGEAIAANRFIFVPVAGATRITMKAAGAAPAGGAK